MLSRRYPPECQCKVPVAVGKRSAGGGSPEDERAQGGFQSNDVPEKASNSQFICPFLLVCFSKQEVFVQTEFFAYYSKQERAKLAAVC